jgi:hypothetical protein
MPFDLLALPALGFLIWGFINGYKLSKKSK